MSDLQNNDFAVIINKRVLANLATTEDMTLQGPLLLAEGAIDTLAALNPLIGTFIRQGLDDPVELAADVAMPVPRLLFATSNPAYPSVFSGITDRARLFDRLRQFDNVASGPVLVSLPPDIAGFNNPIPITVKADSNARFTFFRPTFFDTVTSPDIHVTASRVTITISGQAFRGDVFSSFQARHAPTHNFTLTLNYVPVAVQAPPYAMGVNFIMTSAPLPGTPPFPAVGQVVYARKFGDNNYALPVPLAGQPPTTSHQVLEAGADAFHGSIDDLIYEPGNLTAPIYRVEPFSDAEPTRPVIRKIGSPTVLAEAQGGRLALAFVGVTGLSLPPIGGNPVVSSGELAVIARSLIKIDPTLAQVFLSAEGVTSAAMAFSELDLLGASGFDIPFFLNDLMLVQNPFILLGGDGSVTSTNVLFDFNRTAFFVDQSFAVYGVIKGNPPGLPLANFSADADLSMAISQNAANALLIAVAQGQLDQIVAQASSQGIPLSSPTLGGGFVSDAEGDGMFAVVSVHGTVKFLFFDVGFDVHGFVRLNLLVRPTIAADPKTGDPLDINGCTIPLLVLAGLGLDIPNGQLETSDPTRNPLCFVPYYDPLNGLPPVGFPPPQRVPPPIYLANGDEIPFLQAITMSVCGGQKPPDSSSYGQASFPPFDVSNAGLKHHRSMTVKPPGENDVKIQVDEDFWAVILNALFGIFLAALSFLIPGVGPFLSGALMFVMTNVILLAPFINLIASTIATGIARDALRKVNRPSVDVSIGHSGLFGLYLDDPAVRTPVLVEQNLGGINQGDNALVTRFHVVLGVSDTNFGIKV